MIIAFRISQSVGQEKNNQLTHAPGGEMIRTLPKFKGGTQEAEVYSNSYIFEFDQGFTPSV